jgi:hypothetical protein|tara:strand:- start:822 stop:1058 length:237 start_codon:yes stop_codon:yes gene_type:complete
MDTKNLYRDEDSGFTVLTDNILYDEIDKEIVLRFGRLQVSLELEEFISVLLEFEEAGSLIHNILLTKVQNTQDEKEIN